MSNDGRMRWRMTVAEETQQTVGGRGVTRVLTTITQKQLSTNEKQQRRRAMMVGERWGVVVEVNEQLFGG
jgi:hypothetical protein